MPQPISAMLNETLETRRFAVLLVSLMVALFILPLFATPENEGVVFRSAPGSTPRRSGAPARSWRASSSARPCSPGSAPTSSPASSPTFSG